ncbi:MAG: alpha/beta hydrolase domain-containing protein, partial [Bryobacteraceae bacterium]
MLAGLSSAQAKLVRIAVEERVDVLGGRAFGKTGAYECIRGRAYFAVDPRSPMNGGIVDLANAAVNEAGQVEFSADLFLLKPRDATKGNGTLLLEPPNRGSKGLLATFNRGKANIDPADVASFGDGFLLNEGYTLAWLGWQHDVPADGQRMRLFAPVAVNVEGLVRSEFTADRPVTQFSLGDAGHVPYAVADPRRVSVTVRDGIYGARRALPNTDWSVEDATNIWLKQPAIPGHIYEVIYPAKNPVIAGLGLAGIRDLVSYLKFTEEKGSIQRAIGLGTSQSAMAVRALLYQGFNQDEDGRKVFDGIYSNVAGARRSTFQRFTQPSRTAGPMRNASYSTTD